MAIFAARLEFAYHGVRILRHIQPLPGKENGGVIGDAGILGTGFHEIGDEPNAAIAHASVDAAIVRAAHDALGAEIPPDERHHAVLGQDSLSDVVDHLITALQVVVAGHTTVGSVDTIASVSPMDAATNHGQCPRTTTVTVAEPGCASA